jgi:hypothetical protein
MAVTNFSPLLGLALPTTGDLSGTWGTTVNDAITSLLDSAVAGTTTLSADADVTLTTTNGASNQARNAVILWTASNGATTRNITAPAQSKAYVVINAGTGSIVVRGSGPTTGVTIISGEKTLIAWNGSDFVKVASTATDVLSLSVATANGFAGSSSGGQTPVVTLTTSVTGITKGNGTALSAATANTDYLTPPSGTAILKANSGGALANATAGTDYVAPGGALGTPSSGTLTNCTVDGTNAVGYRKVPAVGAKTSSYTLTTADIGEYVEIGSGGSIVIPDATFSNGDIISVFNNTSDNATITCSITTAYLAGVNADRASLTLATRGLMTVLFLSGTVCVISGNVS